MSLLYSQNRCTAFNCHQKEMLSSAFLPKLKHYYVIFLPIDLLFPPLLSHYDQNLHKFMQKSTQGYRCNENIVVNFFEEFCFYPLLYTTNTFPSDFRP